MKFSFLKMTNRRAQSILQYGATLGIVTAVIVGMGTGIKRSMQAAYKNVTDEIGFQTCGAEGASAANCAGSSPARGYVDEAISQELKFANTRQTQNNGQIILEYDEKTDIPYSQTNSHYGTPPEN